MSVIQNNILAGASGQGGSFELENSLRFRGAQYLTRVNTGTNNSNDRFTISFWVKRGTIGTGVIQACVSGIDNSSQNGNWEYVGFWSDDAAYMYNYNWGAGVNNGVQRDPSAWYHIVAYGASSVARTYVNGVQVAIDLTGSKFSWALNTTGTAYIGCANTNTGSGLQNFFDGYLAEIRVLDGTSSGPTAFGELNDEGVWVPKNPADLGNLNYGNNGFYLDFSDPADIGADRSGNGNDFTATGFQLSTATSESYDWMEDTPTNNWCTLNPLNRGSDNPTVNNGNLYLSSASTDHTVVATFAIPSSGKWYWEYSKTTGANLMSGIIHSPETGGLNTYLGGQNNGYSVYAANGQKYTGAIGNQTYMATPSTSTTITIAFDADTNKLYFGADGNWGDGSGNTDETFANAAVAYTVPTGNTYYPAISFNGGNAFANFGQREFNFTPPTGYEALNTANLPEPTIKDGKNHFDTLIYTGNATARSITGLNFAPDFVWHKARNAADDHRLMDSVRAGDTDLSGEILFSNLTDSEANLTGELTQTSNGFDLVATTNFNTTNRTFVAWNWKANGTGSSNTDGSITSTVSANADAGFSIVSYTGNGNAGATIGHGLGVAPDLVIVKGRSFVQSWSVYHSANTSAPETDYLVLNATNATADNAGFWNDTAPSSTVVTIGNHARVNSLNETFIAYCFAEVEGYSKFGSYTGNGSTNGPFVHCGFRPAVIWTKRSDGTSNWYEFDDKRNSFNLTDNKLEFNSNGAEYDGYNNNHDLLSNGFKLRSSDAGSNGSGGTYIFGAWAANPFKYANAR